MKSLVFLMITLIATYTLQAQDPLKFTSLSQMKSYVSKKVIPISTSKDKVEILLFVEEGIFIINNKTKKEIQKLNLTGSDNKDTWTCFSPLTKKQYILTIINTEHGLCMVVEDLDGVAIFYELTEESPK